MGICWSLVVQHKIMIERTLQLKVAVIILITQNDLVK